MSKSIRFIIEIIRKVRNFACKNHWHNFEKKIPTGKALVRPIDPANSRIEVCKNCKVVRQSVPRPDYSYRVIRTYPSPRAYNTSQLSRKPYQYHHPFCDNQKGDPNECQKCRQLYNKYPLNGRDINQMVDRYRS